MKMMIVVVSLDMRTYSIEEAASHQFARRSVKLTSTSNMAFLEILSSLGFLRKGMKNRKSASCSRIILLFIVKGEKDDRAIVIGVRSSRDAPTRRCWPSICLR